MATGEYAFRTSGRFEPYLYGGAGLIGLAWDSEDQGFAMAFGFHLGAGVRYTFSPPAAVFIEARYTSSVRPDLTYAGINAGIAYKMGGGEGDR